MYVYISVYIYIVAYFCDWLYVVRFVICMRQCVVYKCTCFLCQYICQYAVQNLLYRSYVFVYAYYVDIWFGVLVF